MSECIKILGLLALANCFTPQTAETYYVCREECDKSTCTEVCNTSQICSGVICNPSPCTMDICTCKIDGTEMFILLGRQKCEDIIHPLCCDNCTESGGPNCITTTTTTTTTATTTTTTTTSSPKSSVIAIVVPLNLVILCLIVLVLAILLVHWRKRVKTARERSYNVNSDPANGMAHPPEDPLYSEIVEKPREPLPPLPSNHRGYQETPHQLSGNQSTLGPPRYMELDTSKTLQAQSEYEQPIASMQQHAVLESNARPQGAIESQRQRTLDTQIDSVPLQEESAPNPYDILEGVEGERGRDSDDSAKSGDITYDKLKRDDTNTSNKMERTSPAGNVNVKGSTLEGGTAGNTNQGKTGSQHTYTGNTHAHETLEPPHTGKPAETATARLSHETKEKVPTYETLEPPHTGKPTEAATALELSRETKEKVPTYETLEPPHTGKPAETTTALEFSHEIKENSSHTGKDGTESSTT